MVLPPIFVLILGSRSTPDLFRTHGMNMYTVESLVSLETMHDDCSCHIHGQALFFLPLNNVSISMTESAIPGPVE